MAVLISSPQVISPVFGWDLGLTSAIFLIFNRMIGTGLVSILFILFTSGC